jgi:hypothetical protein
MHVAQWLRLLQYVSTLDVETNNMV